MTRIPNTSGTESVALGEGTIRSIFRTKTRDEWTERFVDVDACVTPVLSPREAPHHPYNAQRNVFSLDGATSHNRRRDSR